MFRRFAAGILVCSILFAAAATTAFAESFVVGGIPGITAESTILGGNPNGDASKVTAEYGSDGSVVITIPHNYGEGANTVDRVEITADKIPQGQYAVLENTDNVFKFKTYSPDIFKIDFSITVYIGLGPQGSTSYPLHYEYLINVSETAFDQTPPTLELTTDNLWHKPSVGSQVDVIAEDNVGVVKLEYCIN